MAKEPRAQQRKQQKKRERRRVEKQRRQGSSSIAKPAASKLADKLDVVYHLVEGREFDEAEELLNLLAERYDRYPDVANAQVYLYQQLGDHGACSLAAKRLAELTPRDPAALVMYAQESMFCGRIGIGLANYRRVVEGWPDDPHAKKARTAIGFLEGECEKKIRELRLEQEGLDLLVLFEEIMELLQANRFEVAAQRCLEVHKAAPHCTPAKNNLAICYFQTGAWDKALHVAEETHEQDPENGFATAMLGKMQFLTGDADEANAVADQLVGNPPTKQDPVAATIELLGFLGRDEDLLAVSERALEAEDLDPVCEGVILHHRAAAQCRLGDEKAARASWKKCLKAMPSYGPARDNLDDLESGAGHAPWFESLTKWIPRAVIDNLLRAADKAKKSESLELLSRYPAIAALVPALLDRGDPVGRELAKRIAIADGSPAMLDALQAFAFGSRGPDQLRHDALMALREAKRIDGGPHRFYSRGKWTEIKLFTAEITWETEPDSNPEVQDLIEAGVTALHEGDYSLAEESFERVLETSPDHCSAAYNLCVVWLERDGRQGRQRAAASLEDLHARFPKYLFAPITLAQFAAMEGDVDRAADLLKPATEAARLHISEAAAMFVAQIEIALQRREFDMAEQFLASFGQIAEEDDPRIDTLRRKIDAATTSRRLRRLIGW